MIEITKELLSKKFIEFNNDYFNGILKTPKFKITNNISRFGQFSSRDWSIEISTAFVRSERDYWNTFLHEMTHLYIRQKYGRMAQSHGKEWKAMANHITSLTSGRYGILKRVGGCQDKYYIRDSKMSNYVVFTDYNGKPSIAKCNDAHTYFEKLKRLGGIKLGTTYYFIISKDGGLNRCKKRKTNSNGIWWNYNLWGIDYIKSCSRILKEETYTTLKNVG